MIIIDDILISSEVVEKQFACKLDLCKGACCYEGDYGAPLEKPELEQIGQIISKLKAYLPEKSWHKIHEKGFYTFNETNKIYETALMDDAACVFMGRDDSGITYCAIEKAYYSGLTDFKKPISCHLYPVRVRKNKEQGFEALNYDEWDICKSACINGSQNNIRVFEFVKEALIRKYGEEFYTALSEAAEEFSAD